MCEIHVVFTMVLWCLLGLLSINYLDSLISLQLGLWHSLGFLLINYLDYSIYLPLGPSLLTIVQAGSFTCTPSFHHGPNCNDSNVLKWSKLNGSSVLKWSKLNQPSSGFFQPTVLIVAGAYLVSKNSVKDH